MTLPPDTVERVLTHIRKRVAESSVEESLDRIRGAADELHVAARGVPDFEHQQAAKDWSAHDCLAHIVEWNVRNAREILYVALSGELPPEEATVIPAERELLIAAHEESLESLFAHVREAAPDAFLHVTWLHPFFGRLNWREWLAFLEVHSKDHTHQLRAMQGA